jgi:neutral ceramidase
MAPYRFGIGKADITGPCLGLGFMGMSRCAQTGRGIHTRLFSRAFVIEDPESRTAVAIVCADLGIISQLVKDAVIEKLAHAGPKEPGGLPRFRDENVLISATHTHSGPGGYSAFLMYNFSMGGFNPQNFEIIVNGIADSIIAALKNMRKGTIYLASGELPHCGWIRSKPAYIRDPEVAKDPIPPDDVEPLYRRMTLLAFVDESGTLRGSVNWFALHPTNMGERNRLISGDNKGYAEQLFEYETREHGGIAAFANSCCGDNSPNVGRGVPLGKHDVTNVKEFGEKQFELARTLSGSREYALSGPIDFRHVYIDMSNYSLANGTRLTWPAALGYGMLNGSQEDSTGLGLKEGAEGTTRANFGERIGDIDTIIRTFRGLAGFLAGLEWPEVKPEYEDAHGDKKIFVPLGWMERGKNPVAPSVVPLQLVCLGGLLLVAHPGELTTVAGLRLRSRMAGIFGPDSGVTHIEVAGYANAYASYTTTPEEYAAQQYEGASTLFGPRALDAYLDAFATIAADLMTGRPSTSPSRPVSVKLDKLDVKNTHVAAPDYGEPGYPLGTIMDEVRGSYRAGETVEFRVLVGHPNRDPANLGPKPGWPGNFQNTFFVIVRKGDESKPTQWVRDDDFQTTLDFGAFGRAHCVAVRWLIPVGQTAGIYRIAYAAPIKTAAAAQLGMLRVASKEFSIVP